jgi:hypothetical protein
MPPDANHFKLYEIRNFLEALRCEEIIAGLAGAEASAATVYGRGDSGAIDERTRKAARVTPSLATFETINKRLLDSRQLVWSIIRLPPAARHWRLRLLGFVGVIIRFA